MCQGYRFIPEAFTLLIMNNMMSNKIIIIILLLVVMPCYQIYAQEYKPADFLSMYDKDTIYLYSDYFGKWYVKNGQIMPLGRFGANMQREVKSSVFAMEEMNKARYHAKIGTFTGFIAGTIGITVTVLEIFDVDYSHKREVYISTILSSAILGAISKGFHQSSVGALNRAVWIYNRDIISGKMSN
jgi:hypothetical protein